MMTKATRVLACAVVIGTYICNVNVRARILWVSERGDDRTAVAGDRNRPWKTVYDCSSRSNQMFYGAVLAAKPGDWIALEPGTYRVPAIPLCATGKCDTRGLNLFVSAGATIIRSDFSNPDGSPLPASLTECGPLIVPGKRSRILVEGRVIATNSSVYDAVFGWSDLLEHFDPTKSSQYGFANRIATDVYLGGHGYLIGSSDVIYVTSWTSRSPATVVCGNLHLRSKWDCSFLSGRIVFSSRNLDVYAEADLPGGASHGIVVLSGAQWIDRGSVFAASGGNAIGDRNAAALVFEATNQFRGTVLLAYGVSNVIPLLSIDSKTTGWYFGYGSGTNHQGKVMIR